MKTISLIFLLVALSTNSAISKIYEYKNYLEDNNIQPLVKLDFRFISSLRLIPVEKRHSCGK